MKRKVFSGAFALAACCSTASLGASAADFSALYTFGGSLSDVGNVYLRDKRNEAS
jgi:phospholipase/lecithinase/hemolysin